MLDQSDLIAFLTTTNGAASRRFYEGTLGLRVLSDDDFALALDAHGTMLRVQKVPKLTPAPATALGWSVTDIAQCVDALRARGVTFERFAGMEQDDRDVWHSPSGAMVAWFRDPDGHTLSLTQLAAR